LLPFNPTSLIKQAKNGKLSWPIIFSPSRLQKFLGECVLSALKFRLLAKDQMQAAKANMGERVACNLQPTRPEDMNNFTGDAHNKITNARSLVRIYAAYTLTRRLCEAAH